MADRATIEFSVTAAGGVRLLTAADPRESPRLLVVASTEAFAELQAERSTGTTAVKTLQQQVDEGGATLEHRDVPWGGAALLFLIGNRAAKLTVRNIGEYAFFIARFGGKEWPVCDMTLLDLSVITSPLVLALRGSSENQAALTPLARPPAPRPPPVIVSPSVSRKRKQLPPPPVDEPPPVPRPSSGPSSSRAQAPIEVPRDSIDLPAVPAAPGLQKDGLLRWRYGPSRFAEVQPHVFSGPRPSLSFSVPGGGSAPPALSIADVDVVCNDNFVVVINRPAIEAAKRLAAAAIPAPAKPEPRPVTPWRDTGRRLSVKGSEEVWTPLADEAETSLPTRRVQSLKRRGTQRQVLLSDSRVERIELHECDGLWSANLGRKAGAHVLAAMPGAELRLVVATELLDPGREGWPLLASANILWEGLTKAASDLCRQARARGWRPADARELALSYMEYESRVKAARDRADVPLHLMWQMADSASAQEYSDELNARCRAAQA